MSSSFPGFKPALFTFLTELAANNNRDWFTKNKARYEQEVREPALDFIDAMEPYIRGLSPYFEAIPSKAGGSLMRVYRDTRFSKDKTPYKTNVGIQFRHETAKDVHAPGYYVHLAPDECFLGIGTWHPPSDALAAIRQQIVDEPRAWKKARDHKPFRTRFDLVGDSLKRPPRGVPPDHECMEDLKRKDHIGLCAVTRTDLRRKDLPVWVGKQFATGTPYMKFLCTAVDVKF